MQLGIVVGLVAALPWTCSCSGVDWAAAGFDGRVLGWLHRQCPHAHRAEHRARTSPALRKRTARCRRGSAQHSRA